MIKYYKRCIIRNIGPDVVIISLTLIFSCKLDNEKKSFYSKETPHAVAAKNEVEPESTPSKSHSVPNPFTTDRYFEFMFKEQDLRWEEMESMKKIEEKYAGQGDGAEEKKKEIRAMLIESGEKRTALFAEYGISPDQWAALHTNPEAKKEREVFIKFNQDVRDRMNQYHDNQKQIQEFYQSLK